MIIFTVKHLKKDQAKLIEWAWESRIPLYYSDCSPMNLEEAQGFIKMYWDWGSPVPSIHTLVCSDEDYLLIKLKYSDVIIAEGET